MEKFEIWETYETAFNKIVRGGNIQEREKENWITKVYEYEKGGGGIKDLLK